MDGSLPPFRTDKVLVCSLVEGRVRVWGWFTAYPDWLVEAAAAQARRDGWPTWIERYGAPAGVPDQPRGFERY